MIVWLCIAGYSVIGAIYARILRNQWLDDVYKNHFNTVTGNHASEFEKREYCLKMAKDDLQDQTSYIFLCIMCGLFWPIAAALYILKAPWLCIKFFADFFFASKAEKEIRKLTKTNEDSNRQRKELDEAIESAKTAEIDTKILEELRKSL